MAKFKVGDYFAPKPGTDHHRWYGEFVGRVTWINDDSTYFNNWEVIEEGIGNLPIVKGGNPNSPTEDMMNITDIYNSPLWNALK